MKKALGILNNRLLSLERHIAIFGTGKNKYLDDVINMEIQEVNEAIKELEALGKRSCDNCKEYYNKCNYIGVICGEESKEEMKNFCCNEWQSKC